VLPPELADRAVLRDECMATLRRWIPTLDKATKDQLRQVMTGYAAPLG
jgi:hypothetical protein